MNVDAESTGLTPVGDRLRITEIFYSIQGEAQFSGWPTVFVRLTGCPLRCNYCDTAYAFTGGEWRSIDSIVTEVASYPTSYVCVTGGEPLAQRPCPDLLTRLCDRGYRVALETSGAMDISVVDPRVHRVVDVKTPGSGEVDRNRWEDLSLLNEKDSVKMVICDRADYDWARRALRDRIEVDCQVFFMRNSRRENHRVMDSGGPPAGADADSAPQGPVGRCARPLSPPARASVEYARQH